MYGIRCNQSMIALHVGKHVTAQQDKAPDDGNKEQRANQVQR